MAFNPMHEFRRYSKVIFAILAIICMFTFVLSSGMGRGDLFTQMGDWMGGGRKASTVISVAGKNFDANEVNEIRARRMLASDYMDAAIRASQGNIVNRVAGGLNKLDPTSANIVQRIVQDKLFRPQQYLEAVRNAPLYDQFLRNFIEQAQRDNKTEEVATLTGVRALLLQDYRQLGRRAGDSFFGGPLRERDLESTADFLLWLHQADLLGIKLTQADIKQAIADEVLGELKPENAAMIDRALRESNRNYTVDGLYSALGDELRVRLAQSAFLGTGSRTRTASPDYLTPEQEWDLFKDARTTVRAGMIVLPVASFVDKVTQTPTEDELKKLFDQYKNDEPIPYLERPGFKEPRRIQVEWVSAKPDSAFFQKAARELTPVFRAVRLLAFLNPGEAALAALALDGELYYAHRDYMFRESPWTDGLMPRMHDTSVVRPQTIKALVGGVIGAAGTGATVFSGPLAFEGSVALNEIVDRVRIGLGMIGFGSEDAYGSAAAALAMTPEPLSLEVLRRSLIEKSLNKLAAGLLDADLIAFRAKVIELGKDKDKAALNKTVNEYIAQRGMLRNATTELRDQFDLKNDPGMARLKEVYLRAHGAQDPLAFGFSAEFFSDPSQTGGISTFVPHEYPAPADEGKFVYWLTEDRDARVPAFAKARNQVVDAWKWQKARELARAAADKLKVDAQRAQGDVPQLRDLAAQNGNREFFEVGPLARRMPVPSAVAGAARQYQQPTISQEKIAFPGADLMDGLLNLRKEPRGAVAVLSDFPKAHFYVTSLLQRDEPSQDEFRRAYVGSMARAVESDRLLPELAMEDRLKFQRELIKQLRELANVVVTPPAGEPKPAAEPEAMPE